MIRTRHLKVVAVALSLLGCGDSSGPTPLSHPRGLLLLSRGVYASAELTVLTPDGSAMRQITRNQFDDTQATWSPDGRRIAFVSARDTTPGQTKPDTDIYMMNADGSGERQLTSSVLQTGLPRWSPDASRIVFQRWDTIGRQVFSQIHIMDSDGRNERALTSGASNNFAADWSPDGSKIVFVSNRAFNFRSELYLMDPNGSNVRQLSDSSACSSYVADPRWSPDGSRIAYSCAIDYGYALHVMNADGTNPIRLNAPHAAVHTLYEFTPTWSPDGVEIAFVIGSDLYLTNASGGTAQRLTRNMTVAYPDWIGPR